MALSGKPIELDVFEDTLRDAIELASTRDTQRRPAAQLASAVSPLSLAREEMLGWVSHEIKSPPAAAMAAIQLAIRGLRHGEAPEAIEPKLAIVTRQLHRMDELVNSLLDAAQLDDGRLALEMKPLVLTDLVAHVLAFWRDTQPDITFETVDSAGPITVIGDPERLRQVLDNFISNAIKYGQVQGERRPIAVSVQSDGERAVVSVTDQGPGIASADLPRLFDRFHRGAAHRGRGHGLGLYIAAAVARLHGGSVTVASELGKGSTFALALPLTGAPPASIR